MCFRVLKMRKLHDYIGELEYQHKKKQANCAAE